jgi:hypothetical protein
MPGSELLEASVSTRFTPDTTNRVLSITESLKTGLDGEKVSVAQICERIIGGRTAAATRQRLLERLAAMRAARPDSRTEEGRVELQDVACGPAMGINEEEVEEEEEIQLTREEEPTAVKGSRSEAVPLEVLSQAGIRSPSISWIFGIPVISIK